MLDRAKQPKYLKSHSIKELDLKNFKTNDKSNLCQDYHTKNSKIQQRNIGKAFTCRESFTSELSLQNSKDVNN
jgi:hypothetical protein